VVRTLVINRDLIARTNFPPRHNQDAPIDDLRLAVGVARVIDILGGIAPRAPVDGPLGIQRAQTVAATAPPAPGRLGAGHSFTDIFRYHLSRPERDGGETTPPIN
jgi:hypothetical protein